jgi:hypothetical protein
MCFPYSIKDDLLDEDQLRLFPEEESQDETLAVLLLKLLEGPYLGLPIEEVGVHHVVLLARQHALGQLD